MILDSNSLDKLQTEASKDTRKRKALLLHHSLEAPSQRMLNALQPGTIVPIHRHTAKEETYAILRGTIKVFFFNDEKEVSDTFILGGSSGNVLLVIPQGQWHTVEVMEPAVIFEVCDGPYQPLTNNDILK